MRPTIDVYCGAPIEIESERNFLDTLCADLRARGVPAVILANFFPPGKLYQIDFVVVTAQCACHVELKNLTAPVSGGVNGAWFLRMPDGSRRALDAKNPYRQALDGKFAISDAMHAFAGRDPLIPRPSDGKRFYTQLMSAVCVFPELLLGSSVYRDHKVNVLGYSDLVTVLTSPHGSPGWTIDQWIAFAMYMGLVRVEDPAGEPPPVTRAAKQAVADYVRRFEGFYGRDLAPLVGTPVEEKANVVLSDALIEALLAGEHLQLTGPSGCGKSLLAKHMALAAARRGRLPIIAAARDYDGKLSVLLDRSVAHAHPDTALQLFRAAEQIGCPPTLIIDGFNECPQRWRETLIKDLQAFYLRRPVPILITAQELVAVPESLSGRALRFAPLASERRVAVLRAYAGDRLPPDAEALAEPFQTPYELSLAAACLEDPACLASRTAMFDAYIRRRCEGTSNALVVRNVLCAVAVRMQRLLASSLPVGEVWRLGAQALEEGGRIGLLTEAIDCGLLDVRQGRCSFRHELIERFLQAESLVRRHASASDLALALMMPRNRPLTEFVIAMEADPGAVRQCLEAIADPAVIAACLRGRYGERARRVAEDDGSRLMTAAEGALQETRMVLEGDENWKRLVVAEGPTWSSYDRAVMQAVGSVLPEGQFLDEAFRLIAATDRRCYAVLSGSGAGGTIGFAAAAHLFTSLYVFQAGDAASGLPASTVYHASRAFRTLREGEAVVGKVLLRVAESLEARTPGELLLTCELLRLGTPDLLVYLPGLLRACWKTRIYHLRLAVLQVAEWNVSRLTREVREEVESVLGTFQSSHILLSTAIVEALLAYDMLQPSVTANDVTGELAAILESPEDPSARGRAYHVLGNIFEEVYQNAYWDAVEQLSRDERVQLLTMGALGAPDDSMFTTSWILRELLRLADPRSLPAYRRWATTLNLASVCPQEALTCYVLGMRGCAQHLDQPPSLEQLQNGTTRAWQAYGAIIFVLNKPGLSLPEQRTAAASSWKLLLKDFSLDTVNPLLELEHADSGIHGGDPRIIHTLCSTFPDEVRQVLELGLANHSRLAPAFTRIYLREDARASLIRWLGVVGDRESAQLLEPLVDSHDLGSHALAALRRINERFPT
jgi:energy-coupling factor transporter ATP-binding protein EcfA2